MRWFLFWIRVEESRNLLQAFEVQLLHVAKQAVKVNIKAEG